MRKKTILKILPIIMAGFILSISSFAFANDGAKAKLFIEKMGDDAVSFLKDESLTAQAKQEKFKNLLNNNFDMNTIARFALGKNWRNASAQQQSEYLKLFNDMIVRVYSSRFEDYKGQGFIVDSFRDTGKQDFLITSYIVPQQGSKIQIDWRVRNKNESMKVIDVYIEGVSMSLTQRSDFSSVIQRDGGNIEALLSHLRK